MKTDNYPLSDEQVREYQKFPGSQIGFSLTNAVDMLQRNQVKKEKKGNDD